MTSLLEGLGSSFIKWENNNNPAFRLLWRSNERTMCTSQSGIEALIIVFTVDRGIFAPIFAHFRYACFKCWMGWLEECQQARRWTCLSPWHWLLGSPGGCHSVQGYSSQSFEKPCRSLAGSHSFTGQKTTPQRLFFSPNLLPFFLIHMYFVFFTLLVLFWKLSSKTE